MKKIISSNTYEYLKAVQDAGGMGHPVRKHEVATRITAQHLISNKLAGGVRSAYLEKVSLECLPAWYLTEEGVHAIREYEENNANL